MKQIRKGLWLGVLFSLISGTLFSAFAPAKLEVTNNAVEIIYPDKAIFKIEFESDVEITNAELSYGTDALACAESASRAFPEAFEPTLNGEAEWEWNFKHTGSLPPGTEVWWAWKLTDANGNEFTTERQHFVFWDETLDWQRTENDHIILYWLDGDDRFAETLVTAGEELAVQLEKEVGVILSEKVTILVFPDSAAMQEATLFLPSWSGGVAFSEYHKVLIGVPTESITWGKRVMRHEMTHVISMQHTFSCVDSFPHWMNEGVAEYFEGDWEESSYRRLTSAVANDTIFSIREISYGFSGDPELARLAYAQSHSIVEYLLEEHGQTKMLALLDEFRAGVPEDKALEKTYGFDRNGLEAAWRIWIGATAIDVGPNATETPTRTPVPTIVPIGGVAASSASSTPVPENTVAPTATQDLETEATANEPAETANEDQNIPATSKLCGSGIFALFGMVLLGVQRKNNIVKKQDN